MPYKKYCCPVSNFVVDAWDGLDESEISRPEILFQSAPAYLSRTCPALSGKITSTVLKQIYSQVVTLAQSSKII